MKSPKTLAIVIGALALLLVGFLFFRSPKPIIEIKAETITDIGPFPLVNTYVSSLTVVIVLAIVAFAATRNISMIPRGLQNVVEAVMEAFYNICINTASEKNGRRFFPVVMTIFTFIWIANWMALLPFFNVIGTVEKVNAEEFKSQAVVFSKSAGISFINRNQKSLEFDKDKIRPESFPILDAVVDDARAAGVHGENLPAPREVGLALGPVPRRQGSLQPLHERQLGGNRRPRPPGHGQQRAVSPGDAR